MKKTTRVCLELPADTVFEQIHEDYSGKVISTTVEADLTLGEINFALSELEHALREIAWEEAEGA